MKKLWDFGYPEQQQQQQQRPPQADTWKDGVTDDGVSADDRYCDDFNYHNSGNDDKYDGDGGGDGDGDGDGDDDYDGSTLSSSRIRRESRKILTGQARDDILRVERFASEMRGRMESLRLRQRERETREGGGNDEYGRVRREREWEDRDREREQRTSSISSTATAAAGTTSTAAPRARRRREEEEGAGGDDIESLVRRGLHKTVAALSPPTVRGGGADGGSNTAGGGNRDIGDGASDPGDGAGLRRFRQSWRGGEEEGERKKQDGGGGRGYSDGPSNSIYTTTESSSKSTPSGIDLGRRWGEHTKEEKGGVGGDASNSNERNGSVSGGNSSDMDDGLEHWWKLQKLRKHQEQLKPVFEELAGEPTMAEVDSSGLTMTRIRQEQHRMHRRCISPPLTTASSSPRQKGGISDATANTHPSSTITAKTASPGHESSRSSRWRGLQQSKSVLDDSNNIFRDNIFLPSLASKSPGSGSIASCSSSRSHPEKYADRRSSVTAVTPERHKNAATISPIKRNSDRTTYDIICSYNDTNRDGRLPPPQPTKTASRTSPLPITGSAVTGYQHRSENATNHDDCAHVTRINPPLTSTRMSSSSPVSQSAPADGYCDVDDGNKNEKIINDASNSDRVADGSTLSILLQRIEETKSSFTRALLEGSLEEQTKMANLMTTLGEAAVTLRKLETSKEMREREE